MSEKSAEIITDIKKDLIEMGENLRKFCEAISEKDSQDSLEFALSEEEFINQQK